MHLRKTAIFGGLILAFVSIWVLTPRETAPLVIAFDETLIGDNMTAYLASREARFDDITGNVGKQIIWDRAREPQNPG